MSNSVKSNNNHSISNYAFVMMAVFFAGFFLISDLSLNVPVMVVFLTLFEIGVLILSRRFKVTLNSAHIPYYLFALMIIINLRPNGYIEEQPFYLFSMLMFLFIMPLCKPGDVDRNRVISIALVTSVIVAVLVYLSMFLPDIFSSIYLNLVSRSSREYNQWIMRQGYSGTVGADIGKTAAYITLGLSFTFSRFLYYKDKKNLLITMFLLLALALVGRRSELLAFILASLLILYESSSRGKKQRLILIFMALLIVIIALYFLIASNVITYSGKNRIINSLFLLIHGEDISNGRLRLYAAAIESFREHPIFGIGWGGARSITRKILSNDVNVHNIYLQLLCEVGIVGTIFGLIMVLVILNRRRTIFKKYLGTNKSVYTTSALLVSIYITILGLLDNPIYHDDFWLLVSIIFFMTNNLEEPKKVCKI